jgi:hypothetical protein
VVSGVDSPWQVAATKMDALLARPAIDHERLTLGVCMLDNWSGIFQLVSPTGQVYRLDRVLLDSGAQPLMSGKAHVLVWVFGGQSLNRAHSKFRHHLVELVVGLTS